MIRNKDELTKFYEDLANKEGLSHRDILKIFDAWCDQAVALGIFNSENIMDGFEVDLRIAKAVNRLK